MDVSDSDKNDKGRPLTPDEVAGRMTGQYTPEMVASISDVDEAEKFQRLMMRMAHDKPYLVKFMVDMVRHTGREAFKRLPTAGVWISNHDLAIHIAANPLFMDGLLGVEVLRGLLPMSEKDRYSLRGASASGTSFTVFESDPMPPRFEAIFRTYQVPLRRPNEWVAFRFDFRKQIAVLEHEIRHVLDLHLLDFMDRTQFPDAQVLNCAMDLAINQHIQNLPDKCITVENYAKNGLVVPREQSFREYYPMLVQWYADASRGEPPEEEELRPAAQGVPAGTQICVPGRDGTMATTPVERLKSGDLILTPDASGTLVVRFIVRVRIETASSTSSEEVLATSMMTLRTRGGRTIRASSRMKVWSTRFHPPGPYAWDQKSRSLVCDPWLALGPKFQGSAFAINPYDPDPPPVNVGDSIWVLDTDASGAWVQDVVEFIATDVTKDDEPLYHIRVQEVGNVSSFFANGILLKGITSPTPPPPPPGDGPEGEPPPKDPTLDTDSEPESEGSGPGKPPKPEPKPGEPGEDEPGEGEPEPGEGEPGEGEPGEGDPSPTDTSTKGRGGKPDKPYRKVVPAPLDSHDVWEDGADGRIERQRIREWAEKVRDACKRDGEWGSMPSDLKSRLDEILADPTQDWRREFRKLVGQYIKVGHVSTRKRPNRRFDYDFPGRKVVRSSRIIVAMDASGSMQDPELEQIFNEMGAMLQNKVEIVFIIWDVEILNVDLIRTTRDLMRRMKEFGRGGGTNVDVVFQALNNPMERLMPESAKIVAKPADLLIVFTDGDLDWSVVKPGATDVPVIWGITRENNLTKPPYGIVLHVDVASTQRR